MPTIDQLAAATASSDTDELMVSQNGVARKATRAQILAGLQPQIALTSGSLLGRSSAGVGSAEPVSIGANLTLSNGKLSAAAAAYVVSELPSGTTPATNDLVPLSQAGANTAVTYSQFMSALSGVPNLDASEMKVVPSGDTTPIKLADFVAGTLPISGGQLTGPLALASDPVRPPDAATKQYVDAQTSTALPKTGGSLTGPVVLAADPSQPLHPATKQYVDNRAAGLLPTSGGTLTGALTLSLDPAAPLQAATKQYVDTQTGTLLPRSGGALTGALTLPADPVQPLQPATKQYVDALSAAVLPKAGGTMNGPVILASDPILALQAATKQYVDGRVQRSGDTMTGALTLVADPVQPLHAATKGYVDGSVAANGVLNVRSAPFGAKLDGRTDDTAAFKAAYQAAAANSVIYVPAGVANLQNPNNWGIPISKRVKWIGCRSGSGGKGVA